MAEKSSHLPRALQRVNDKAGISIQTVKAREATYCSLKCGLWSQTTWV